MTTESFDAITHHIANSARAQADRYANVSRSLRDAADDVARLAAGTRSPYTDEAHYGSVAGAVVQKVLWMVANLNLGSLCLFAAELDVLATTRAKETA